MKNLMFALVMLLAGCTVYAPVRTYEIHMERARDVALDVSADVPHEEQIKQDNTPSTDVKIPITPGILP